MARYTGPKFRLDRRLGVNLLLKGSRSLSSKHPLSKKGAVAPGQHGHKNVFKKLTDYAKQLREKQKARLLYGVLEKQFSNYFAKASSEVGNTPEALFRFLESRLDNVVYRSGFSLSRSQARQLVNHGHVRVNNKKVDVPSYNVKVGDVISLSPKAQNFVFVQEGIKDSKTPVWLERKALVSKVLGVPKLEDLDIEIDFTQIVEFYSR